MVAVKKVKPSNTSPMDQRADYDGMARPELCIVLKRTGRNPGPEPVTHHDNADSDQPPRNRPPDRTSPGHQADITQRRQWLRFVQMVALGKIDPQLPQRVQYGLGLDEFGHGLQAHFLRDGIDGLDHYPGR